VYLVSATQATSRKLSDVSFEFPQINHPMVQSKQHRYV
jgi:hypothetical protein